VVALVGFLRTGSRLLAEYLGEDISVAYTVGLLHSAGIVAIDEWP